MNTLKRGLLSAIPLLVAQTVPAALKPLLFDKLNSSYDFPSDVSSKSANSEYVDFSAQYPAGYNGDLILEGANLHLGGSGPALEVPAFRMNSHTSNAINVKAIDDNEIGFVEFRFSSLPQAVHPSDLFLFLEGFNLTEQIQDQQMTIEVSLVDPFGSESARTVSINWKIIDYVRAFRAGQLGNNPPVLQRTAIPSQCYPLQLTQPFMDLQTYRFTEADLKMRVDKVRISVPRLMTLAKISGLPNPVVVNGGIRVHGVAIGSGFYFGAYSKDQPYQPDGPWFTQANSKFGSWTQAPVNSTVPASDETIFQNAGCWISSWATVMSAQGSNKVQAFNSTQVVNLTPLTLARYAEKLGLFKNDNSGISLPSYNLPTLLNKINQISGNTKLEYRDQVSTDVSLIEDYLARKIPVLLKVAGHEHFVVANGMAVFNYQGNWIKTYFINDVGYTDNIFLVNNALPLQDWQNQFDYALVMAPADKSVTSSLAIEIFSPAYPYITDPIGRRRGLNPADGIFYDEIPRVTESVGDPARTMLPLLGIPPDPDPEKYLHINQPLDGQYNIQVVGTGTGSYTLVSTRINAFGKATADVIHGTTTQGQVDPLTLAYTDASGDVTAPVTAADYADTAWNRVNSLVVHFNATDDASGVAQTLVSLDGADPQALNSISIAQEGPHHLEFWSEDAAGNVESHKVLNVRNDFTPPVTTNNYSGTGTETSSISIQFQASDNLSGVGESFLILNGIQQSGFGTLTLSQPGQYDIEYYSIDIAGNIEEKKLLDIAIESTGPMIQHLKAKAKGTEVSLKWTPDEATMYSVLRSTQGPTSGFVEIGRTADRKFEDSGLSIGTTYFYKVTSGSRQSEVVSVTVIGGH